MIRLNLQPSLRPHGVPFHSLLLKGRGVRRHPAEALLCPQTRIHHEKIDAVESPWGGPLPTSMPRHLEAQGGHQGTLLGTPAPLLCPSLGPHPTALAKLQPGRCLVSLQSCPMSLPGLPPAPPLLRPAYTSLLPALPESCSCCLKALSQQRHPLPHPWHFLSALCKPTSSPTPSQSSLTHLKNHYQCPVSHHCLPYTLQCIQPQTPPGNGLSLHTGPFKVPV